MTVFQRLQMYLTIFVTVSMSMADGRNTTTAKMCHYNNELEDGADLAACQTTIACDGSTLLHIIKSKLYSNPVVNDQGCSPDTCIECCGFNSISQRDFLFITDKTCENMKNCTINKNVTKTNYWSARITYSCVDPEAVQDIKDDFPLTTAVILPIVIVVGLFVILTTVAIVIVWRKRRLKRQASSERIEDENEMDLGNTNMAYTEFI